MKGNILLYVPSDTPEAMVMATRRIAGVPLIVRGIMTLQQAGAQSLLLLVAKSQLPEITRFLSRYKRKPLPKIIAITYDEGYVVNSEIAVEIEKNSLDNLLFINANLIFDNDFIKNLNSTHIQGDEVVVCHEGNHLLPVVKFPRHALSSLVLFTKSTPRPIENCIHFLIERSKLKTIQTPATSNTFLIRKPRERIVAEKFLAESIRLSTNGPVAKLVNKRFSLPISVFLSRLWISPHAITGVNIIIGLLSGVFMAGTGYLSLLIGGTLFQIASVADGVDGEVSKLTFRSSKFGQFIDTVSDNLALASCLIGLTIGTSKVFNPHLAIVTGSLSMFNVIFVIWLMVRYLKKNTDSASLATFNKVYLEHLPGDSNPILTWFISHFKFFTMKDCFSALIFVFALLGILPAFLFFVALGSTLAAVSIGYLQLFEKRQRLQVAEKKS